MAIVQKGLSLSFSSIDPTKLLAVHISEEFIKECKELKYLWGEAYVNAPLGAQDHQLDPDLMKPIRVTKTRQCGKSRMTT